MAIQLVVTAAITTRELAEWPRLDFRNKMLQRTNGLRPELKRLNTASQRIGKCKPTMQEQRIHCVCRSQNANKIGLRPPQTKMLLGHLMAKCSGCLVTQQGVDSLQDCNIRNKNGPPQEHQILKVLFWIAYQATINTKEIFAKKLNWKQAHHNAKTAKLRGSIQIGLNG